MKWQIVFILSFLVVSLMAQEEEDGRLFQAGIVAGFNASQLDGDKFRGYSKLGANVGLKVKYPIPSKPKIGLSVEMLLSMRGSSSDLNFSASDNTQTKIKLNYIEIPLVLSYTEWKIDFHAGASYGRLFSSSTTELTTVYLVDDFRKGDIGLLLGATYVFDKHWGATIRYNRSVVNTVKKDVNKGALVGHWLTFRVEYLF